jgi:uncharacterized protein YcnI
VNVIRRSLLTALIALLCVAPAAAHVTVKPATAAAGSTVTLTFHCPSELPAATTTQLIVQLPPDAPFAHVEVVPISGWQATLTKRTIAQPIHGPDGDVTSVVDTIAWTGTIQPGASQNFTIRAGPLPRGTGELAFKTLQRYSDGSVVRWIELRNAGEAEPAFPAPVVRLY